MTYFPRTDLALEAFESGRENPFPGVEIHHWDIENIQLTEVIITDDTASSQLGKPIGRYLTLECPHLRTRDIDARTAISAILAEEIARMLPHDSDKRPVLAVGLGNRNITPDALGPMVIDRTLVTRHLLCESFSPQNMANVCAISPGVLGITGIETVEMVECIVQKIQPRAVICIDSLAARSAQRIGATIQLTDTGIQPGAGVGNHRRPLTQDRLHVPVFSIGMPTVIYAATLARDAFDSLAHQTGSIPPAPEALEDMEKRLLHMDIGEMIVTPREIDSLIQDAAGIIATGINRALQPHLSDSEIAAMMD